MATKLLIPVYGFKTPTDIGENMPRDFSSETTTRELRCALDADNYNVWDIYNNSDTPVIFHYSGISTSSFPDGIVANYNSGYYIKIDQAVTNLVSGQYNRLIMRESGNDYNFSTLDIFEHYGDGITPADDYLLVSGQIDGYFETVIAQDGLNTSSYQMLSLINSPTWTDTASGYLCYDVIHGILITLPANGKLSPSPELPKTFFGGQVYDKKYGNIGWEGFAGSKSKRTRTLKYTALTDDEKETLETIFLYGRGCHHMLFMEDTVDKNTWIKCFLRTMSIKEPYQGYWDIEIGMEEV